MTRRTTTARIPSDYDFVEQAGVQYPDEAAVVIGGKRLRLNDVPDAFANGGPRRWTKAMVTEQVAEESGLSRASAAAAVDAVISSIEGALRDGDDVRLMGFGKFHVAERGERTGRNPRTGETMTISATRVPVFKPGTDLRRHVG